MTKLTPHIKRAVKHAGSQRKLAERVGCSQQQISYLMKAQSISAEMAMRLDTATGGVVSRHVLRPDIFGATPPAAEGAAA